jgi:predicted nuclease of restriction endonuclease-like RecB superfamily
MLCRRHALARDDWSSGRVFPDRLTTTAHRQYRGFAERMLDVYRRGTGQPRRTLHQGVRAVLGNDLQCPSRRIDAFCKLLDDASRYRCCSAGEAVKLRQSVFRASARLHPLVETSAAPQQHTRQSATQAMARKLGRSWREIESDLFADVPEYHRLEAFDGYEDGAALLSRYNIAQQQAVLFDAVSMTIEAGRDFKTILRHGRLAGLMHEISRQADGRYRFRFEGPAAVLRRTARYGAAMARFLPALVACRDWTMTAEVKRRNGPRLCLELSSKDGLKSALPPPEEFDSSVEVRFAADWNAARPGGWTMHREADVLYRGQRTFVPDFAFRHESGARVLLEIVGFWTPEYLRAKRETLRMFRESPILLAVAERNCVGLGDAAVDAIVYRSRLNVEEVVLKLEEMRLAAKCTL